MLAFHNDQQIKDKYVKRVINHQETDRIIQGDSKYCAVGCTLDGVYNHKRYEIELGIPEWIRDYKHIIDSNDRQANT